MEYNGMIFAKILLSTKYYLMIFKLYGRTIMGKTLIGFLIVLSLLLSGFNPASATLITKTAVATIAEITIGSLTGFSVGDTIELFTVTWDDAGTEFHQFNNDGTISHTYTKPVGYDFYDDIEFTLSKDFEDIVSQGNNTYQWSTYAYSGTSFPGLLSFRMRHKDFGYFYGDWLLPSYQQDDRNVRFETYKSDSTHNLYVKFSESELITTGSEVPEPATLFLFGLGILGLAGVSRKKQKDIQ
ncbi:MAG: PEP-CTERM sorting domain-containing protein [Desulfobacula sp.]|nr:PEP-CTERM sorting domain-containing protein [Desulfobacula sp.]